MKSKEMAAYVPVVQKMADVAIGFLQAQGVVCSPGWSEPELRLSPERRIKIHGIYNKRNTVSELQRLLNSLGTEADRAEQKHDYKELAGFLQRLSLFLSDAGVEQCGAEAWKDLQREFAALEQCLPRVLSQTANLTVRLKLWQQLVRLFAKVQQLEIKQELSGVFSSEGRIVLYMNNIEAICKKMEMPMEPYLQSVLVHEYAHCCHYAAFMEAQSAEHLAMDKAMLRWSGAYFSRRRVSAVKESLARYMQVLWCRENAPELALFLEAEPRGEYVICPNWPYAGARLLLKADRDEAKSLFASIWQSSLHTWEQAYSMLNVEKIPDEAIKAEK